MDVLEPAGGRDPGRPEDVLARRTARCRRSIHLDTDAPLYTDDGKLVTDELWGIYYKQDRHGIQGGASPLTVGPDAPIDPYPSTTDVDPEFPDMWCAALSHAMSRFEGCRPLYKQARSGGMGAFTVDNFPVFDYMRPNVYGIFDSNHGYKMIGVGREVAKVLVGERSRAALPVPLRALRDGRPAPGLELAVPLVVAYARQRGAEARRALAQRVERARSSLRIEAIGPLKAEDGRKLSPAVEHGHRDRVQPELALAARLAVAARAHRRQLALELCRDRRSSRR